MTEIIIAKNAGACFGVNRSIQIVINSSKISDNNAVYGQLIHNPLIIEELNLKYGIKTINSIESLIDNNIQNVIIRSHGVPINLISNLKRNGFNLINATCPHVQKVQKTAIEMAKNYSNVIIVGKNDHPEVESVKSYVLENKANCFVIQHLKDFELYKKQLLNVKRTIGVVSQTTQSVEVFDNIIKLLKQNNIKIDVKNTICYATKIRQECAKELAQKVDVFFVLGGYNSSNTSHLAQICKQYCKKTFHVESINDVNIKLLKNSKRIGVTAGASTLKSQIDQFVYSLQNVFKQKNIIVKYKKL